MNISPPSLFGALAHDTRLRCLRLLLNHDELCVCELSQAIGAAQPHMSRHLAQLRELELVADRREGLWIHYRLHPDLPEWVRAVLASAAEGVAGQEPYATDDRTLGAASSGRRAPRCA